jgi:dTDP-4-dehydrorhamnose reductase
MRKLLLTGSSSFTGSKFLEIYGKKYDITVISRSHKDDPIDLNDLEAVTDLYNSVKPDAVVHLAATIGRDTGNADVLSVDVRTTKHLIDLAKSDSIPFIYTSSEVVYDGRPDGMYKENDDYNPRSDYGQSKVVSEKYLKEADIPYLITRGNRYIGYPSSGFDRPKQFPDALKDLVAGKVVHAEAKKKANLILVDDICDIIDHYIENDSDKQIVLNMGMPETITYSQLLKDIAKEASLDEDLIHNDGEEAGWLENNTLDTTRLKDLGYPQRNYDEIVKLIAEDIRKVQRVQRAVL